MTMKYKITISSHEGRTNTASEPVPTVIDCMVNLYIKAAFGLIPQPLNIPRLVHDGHIWIGSLQHKFGLRVFRKISDTRPLHLQTPVVFMEDCSIVQIDTAAPCHNLLGLLWSGKNCHQSRAHLRHMIKVKPGEKHA